MQFPYWSLVLDHSGFHLSCFWCLWKILLMRYSPLAVLPCDGNFHLEWEQRGKITKEETQRASADDGKGYSEAKMETSGNKPDASLKRNTASYGESLNNFPSAISGWSRSRMQAAVHNFKWANGENVLRVCMFYHYLYTTKKFHGTALNKNGSARRL